MATSSPSGAKRKLEEGEDSLAKHFRSAYTDTVKVIVEENKDSPFIVYKDLICKHSEFFAAACKKGWARDKERSVRLPDHATLHFKIYVDWLYTQRANRYAVAVDWIRQQSPTIESSEMQLEACHVLCQLWVLGDFLGDETFTNNTMEEFWSLTLAHQALPKKTVDFIIASTAHGTPLRNWFIDYTASVATGARLDAMRASLPPDVMWQLLKRLHLSADALHYERRSPLRSDEAYQLGAKKAAE